jgi:hypothetical protein
MTDDNSPQSTPVVTIDQVVSWILDGNSETTIRDSVKNLAGIFDANPLILDARQWIEQNGGWQICATRHIYQKQVEIGEYNGAGRSLQSLQKLEEASRTTETRPVLTIDPRRATSECNQIARTLKSGSSVPQEIIELLPEVMADILLKGDTRSKVAAGRVLHAIRVHEDKRKPTTQQPIRHEHIVITEQNFERCREIALSRLNEIGQKPDGNQ